MNTTRFIFMSVCIMLVIQMIPSRTIEIEIPKPLTPRELISKVANEFGVNIALATEVAMCESSLRHDGVYGDGKKAYGLYQFHKQTFDLFKEKSGMKDLNYENMEDQTKLAMWAFKNGYGSHWTCYKKYKK